MSQVVYQSGLDLVVVRLSETTTFRGPGKQNQLVSGFFGIKSYKCRTSL